MRKLTIDDSSNVISVTYHDGQAHQSGATSGFLVVQFSSGFSYRYLNCTLDDFASCCHAPSVGRWVQEALVRQKAKHPFERVGPIVADPPRVDQKLVALQVIASLPNPQPSQRSMVRVAREALDGVSPPPLPPHVTPPKIYRPNNASARIDYPMCPDETVTPDEARGVAHALLAAALEAES